MSERHLCGHCFRVLNPNDDDYRLREVLRCDECGTMVHSACQHQMSACHTCGQARFKAVDLPPPPALIPVTRQPRFPASIVRHRRAVRRRQRLATVALVLAVVGLAGFGLVAPDNSVLAVLRVASATTTPTLTLTPSITPSPSATLFESGARPSRTPLPVTRLADITLTPSRTPTRTAIPLPIRTATRFPTRTPLPRVTSTPFLPQLQLGQTYAQAAVNERRVRYAFRAQRGDTITLLLTSTDFDPYLELWQEGRMVAEDNDRGGLPNALINGFSISTTGTYTVVVRAFDDAFFSGDYDLYLYEGSLRLLDNGVGQTDGRRVTDGEFQVEYFCGDRGQDIRQNNDDWYCLRGSTRYRLTPDDFNQICRETYNTGNAVALNTGNSSIRAFNWLCHGFSGGTSGRSSSLPAQPASQGGSSAAPGQTGQRCGGIATLFEAGDTAVVDFNADGALRLLRNYDSTTIQSMALYYDNQRIELLEGPICYSGVWYWRVFNERLGAFGWVAEAQNGDRFLCTTSRPECS